MAEQTDLDQLAVNTIRMLAVDAIQKANSGHPGTPMDAAPTATRCGQNAVCATIPPTPAWINRDRFLLSAGHASMLLYALNLPGGDLGADKPSTTARTARR